MTAMKSVTTGILPLPINFLIPLNHTIFYNVNDFNSSNGTKHHWEITNTFRYRINEHWLPYLELRWLDRNVEPYHREQNQIRIGAKYFF